MNRAALMELESIKRELQNIIFDLDSISAGVRNDFIGIGSDKCANSISNVAGKYRYAKGKLNNIDTSNISEGFESGGVR